MALTQAQKDIVDDRIKTCVDYVAYDVARDAYDDEVSANGVTELARTHQAARNEAAKKMATELGI